ncbi:hypothetical protein SAMN05216311_103461 [Chitinophaga sp. CF418]|nr:hypothetical protein SAMN05216311_103461 [Chitinophaga sp. CF418]
MLILMLTKIKSIPIDEAAHSSYKNPIGSGRLQVETLALVI